MFKPTTVYMWSVLMVFASGVIAQESKDRATEPDADRPTKVFAAVAHASPEAYSFLCKRLRAEKVHLPEGGATVTVLHVAPEFFADDDLFLHEGFKGWPGPGPGAKVLNDGDTLEGICWQPRQPGESRWRVKRRTASTTITRVSANARAAEFAVECRMPGKPNPGFRTTISLSVPEGRIFLIPAEDNSGYIAFTVFRTFDERRSEPPESPPVAVPVANKQNKPTAYSVQLHVTEMHAAVFEELTEALQWEYHDRALVVAREDVTEFLEFCDAYNATLWPSGASAAERSLKHFLTRTRYFRVGDTGLQWPLFEFGNEIPVLTPAGSDGLPENPSRRTGLRIRVTGTSTRDSEITGLHWDVRIAPDVVSKLPEANAREVEYNDNFGKDDALLFAVKVDESEKSNWFVASFVTKTVPVDDDIAERSAIKLSVAESIVEDRKTAQPGATATEVISRGRTISINDDTKTVSTTEAETCLLQAERRIKAVRDFNPDIVRITPKQGDPTQLTLVALDDGATKLTIIDEDDAVQRLEVVVSSPDNGLGLYLRRLYPNLAIEVHPIQGSVLLRGQVGGQEQRKQIKIVAECFYSHVLDQLTVASDADLLPSSASWQQVEQQIQQVQERGRYVVPSSDLPLFLHPHMTLTIECPEPISQMSVSDTDLMEIDSVDNDARELLLRAQDRGTGRIYLTGESQQTYVLDVHIQGDIRPLRILARRLYPEHDVVFTEMNGALILRGTVSSATQARQIVEIGEQYSPRILNYLVVAGTEPKASVQETGAAMRPASRSRRAAENNRAPIAVEPVAGTDATVADVRSEVQALHSDVRELIAILRERSEAAGRKK